MINAAKLNLVSFASVDDSNIFDRIIAQFRTASSRGDEDEGDGEETMGGLQALLLPVIQSVAVPRTRQRGAFSHGNTDDAPHLSRINRPKRVVRGTRRTRRSLVIPHDAFFRGVPGRFARSRGRHTCEGTLIFNISQSVYCSDPRICFWKYIYVIDRVGTCVILYPTCLWHVEYYGTALKFYFAVWLSKKNFFKRETSFMVFGDSSRFGAEIKSPVVFLPEVNKRQWIKRKKGEAERKREREIERFAGSRSTDLVDRARSREVASRAFRTESRSSRRMPACIFNPARFRFPRSPTSCCRKPQAWLIDSGRSNDKLSVSSMPGRSRPGKIAGPCGRMYRMDQNIFTSVVSFLN